MDVRCHNVTKIVVFLGANIFGLLKDLDNTLLFGTYKSTPILGLKLISQRIRAMRSFSKLLRFSHVGTSV
jgi:hypothetical protein